MGLRGRTFLVTGASSGIGAATVRTAAARGARPVALARGEAKLEALAREVRSAGGKIATYAVDCADRVAVEAAARRIVDEVGVPDVLVNNAGSGRYRYFDETEPAEFEALMGAPFFAAVHVTRSFLPGMLDRGSGIVLAVNAPIAYVAWQGAAGYGMSRWALRGFYETLRADLRGTGITVSQVVPGTVSSSYFEHNPGVEEAIPRIAAIVPRQTPERVADAIVCACERERELVFLPWQLRLLVVQARLFPRLSERLVWWTGRKRPARSEGERMRE